MQRFSSKEGDPDATASDLNRGSATVCPESPVTLLTTTLSKFLALQLSSLGLRALEPPPKSAGSTL